MGFALLMDQQTSLQILLTTTSAEQFLLVGVVLLSLATLLTAVVSQATMELLLRVAM